MPNQNFPSVKFSRPLETPEDASKFFVNFFEEGKTFLYLFAGRSNVGKSSLINALYGSKTAKTSKTPGRTQAINVFEYESDLDQIHAHKNAKKIPGMKRFFLDLPGFGHAQVSKQTKEKWDILFEFFFENLPNETIIFHIQDARHPFSGNDLEFLKFLGSEYPNKFLILNKIDKLKNQKQKSQLKAMVKKQEKLVTSYKNSFNCSAEKREGIHDIIRILKLSPDKLLSGDIN